MYEQLKESVCKANIELQTQKLAIFTWGNVSGIDRGANIVAIKPSGVPYEKLTPDEIVLLDLDGNILEGSRREAGALGIVPQPVESVFRYTYAS